MQLETDALSDYCQVPCACLGASFWVNVGTDEGHRDDLQAIGISWFICLPTAAGFPVR